MTIFLRALFISLLGLMFGAPLLQGQDVLVDFNRIYPKEFYTQGFVLERDQEIQIDASGLHYSNGEREMLMVGYCWILDAETRQVVWAFAPAPFSNDRPEAIQRSESLRLPKGTYEAYYSSFSYYERYGDWGYSHNVWNQGFVGRLLDRIFSRDEFSHQSRDIYTKDFFLTVRGIGKTVSMTELEEIHKKQRQPALLTQITETDEQFKRQGFRLSHPTAVNIYAIGEMRENENFDYSFIMNVETREKVWILDYRNSEPAGGAGKNRMSRQTMTLPAGNYVAVSATDDSHSPREWNAPPPHDPFHWGLTIFPRDASQKQAFRIYDYQEEISKNAIVAFTQMRNDAFETKGFRLNRAVDLRIYSIGEGSDGEMYDFGWIVDAKTHNKVWEMDLRKTEHAGGGEKNRLVDTVIRLEKGNYLAYYITDDSHAYRDWNTSPPYDRERWGMTITPVNAEKDAEAIGDYQEEADPDILVKLVMMRDHERKSRRFTLQEETDVWVYALGEGDDGEMYDFGWLENEAGEVIWEMTYRRSDRAGGARKNRMQRERIRLQAGEYRAFYESDGSHSFLDWNAAPPSDPVNWGITITRAN